MSFRLQISLANAAFCDREEGDDPARCRAEIARMLRRTADCIENSGALAQVLHDINGNRVGSCGLDNSSAAPGGRSRKGGGA